MLRTPGLRPGLYNVSLSGSTGGVVVLAPKGRDCVAQGNALGLHRRRVERSPEGAA